jgi:hypothetical protein
MCTGFSRSYIVQEDIRIIALKNVVDTWNQFLPSQYKGFLFVTLFSSALCIPGYDGGPGTGFSQFFTGITRIILI